MKLNIKYFIIFFKLSICGKGLADYPILFYFCFTQHPNFLGIRAVGHTTL